MSGTVIKFYYVHVLSKTVSSQLQHLQHNFQVNYWFNIKLSKDIRISKRMYWKTNLQTKFNVKCSTSGPKVTTKLIFRCL